MAITALALAGFALPLSAQGADLGNGTRLGITFGGTSTVGLVVEFFRDARSVEVGVGTFSFRDVSVSGVVKQYFGAEAVQPFIGAGLWTVIAAPGEPEERTGLALVLHAPIGVDWGFGDRHALGVTVALNRGLAVRRSDPEDTLPMKTDATPLPGLYYRLTR